MDPLEYVSHSHAPSAAVLQTPCSNRSQASQHHAEHLAFSQKASVGQIEDVDLQMSVFLCQCSVQIVLNEVFGSHLNTEHGEKPTSSSTDRASYWEGVVCLYGDFLNLLFETGSDVNCGTLLYLPML